MLSSWRYKIGNWLSNFFPARFDAEEEPENDERRRLTDAQLLRRNRTAPVKLSEQSKQQRQAIVYPNDLPILATAAENGDPNAQAVMREIGVTGLDVRSGKIYQEYNADLQSLQSRMTHFEEMRRSESALGAMEQLVTLPLRQATWDIEYGDDTQFGEFVEWNLFNSQAMTHSFDDMIRVAALAELYGFSIHEKVFEQKDSGYLGWRKFAERERSTVRRWIFDEHGGVQGIRQRGRNPVTSARETHEIPIEKLIIWSWRKEANNPEGFGAMRQAYKHWYYKQAFEEFAAIRIERQAGGIPVAYAPETGATGDETDEMLALLGRLRTGKDAGLVIPDGWEVDLLSLGRADVPFESHIERQHQSMLQTILGQFVGLAQGGDSGAWALSRDSSSLFLMTQEAAADWICDYFNRYAIAQLARYNGVPSTSDYPRLVHGKVGMRDMDEFSLVLSRIFNPKFAVPDNIKDYVRNAMGLPKEPDNDETAMNNTESEDDEQ